MLRPKRRRRTVSSLDVLSVDGKFIDCRSTAMLRSASSPLKGQTQVVEKKVEEMSEWVWFESIRAFLRRKCIDKWTPMHSSHVRSWIFSWSPHARKLFIRAAQRQILEKERSPSRKKASIRAAQRQILDYTWSPHARKLP